MAENQIATVRYTHDAMIDTIIACPEVSGKELAAIFGYSQTWISIIINSDAFKERLTERKANIVDPRLAASVDERINGAAIKALDKIIDRLDNNLPFTNGDLVSVAKLGASERAKAPNPYALTNNYIVQLPPVASNSQNWLEKSSRGASEAVDISPRGLAE